MISAARAAAPHLCRRPTLRPSLHGPAVCRVLNGAQTWPMHPETDSRCVDSSGSPTSSELDQARRRRRFQDIDDWVYLEMRQFLTSMDIPLADLAG